ncbi:hypothetical protein [Bradyrhizobium sp. USDA 3696]
MASDRNTFLGVAACDLAQPLGEADIVIFGAADATPHVRGRTSHAANGPAKPTSSSSELPTPRRM